MRFFVKKQKVNPTSKKLVETTIDKLAEHGVTTRDTQVACANRLMLIFASFIKSLKKGVDVESVSVKYTDDMREVMSKYGITDPLKQEDVILNFISVLSDYMENPNGV